MKRGKKKQEKSYSIVFHKGRRNIKDYVLFHNNYPTMRMSLNLDEKALNRNVEGGNGSWRQRWRHSANNFRAIKEKT